MSNWQDITNVRQAVGVLVNKLGRIPSIKEITMEHPGLPNAIYRHHGNLQRILESIGYNPNRTPAGYWKQWENVEKELQEATYRLGHFPSKNELSQIGKSSVGRAVVEFHGGFNSVRKRLGIDTVLQSRGYMKDSKRFLEEVQDVMKKEGWDRLPSVEVLRKRGYRHIPKNVKYFPGGINGLRRTLGEQPLRSEWGRYNDYAIVLSLVRAKKDKIGRFPLYDELPNGLLWSISHTHHKTLRDIRDDIEGTDSEQITSLLERYACGGQNE